MAPAGWTGPVLTLRPGEGVRVDGPAVYSIVEFLDNRARVRVLAPQSTRIFRDDAAPPPADAEDASGA